MKLSTLGYPTNGSKTKTKERRKKKKKGRWTETSSLARLSGHCGTLCEIVFTLVWACCYGWEEDAGCTAWGKHPRNEGLSDAAECVCMCASEWKVELLEDWKSLLCNENWQPDWKWAQRSRQVISHVKSSQVTSPKLPGHVMFTCSISYQKGV